MSIKKSILSLVGLTTAVLMLGVVAIPQAQAQTTESLQAQIDSLMAIITQLNLVIAGGTLASTPAPSVGAFTFTQNLTIGSTGNEVMQLQKFLNAKGYTVAASGAGSLGNESSYFGTLTQSALAKYQAANGVVPSVGYFGVLSRASVHSMMGPIVGPLPPALPPAGGLPVGCTSTTGFSSITVGLSCGTVTTPTFPPGCTSATGASVTTGLSCGIVAPGVLAGGAGNVTVSQTSTDVEDEVLTGETGKVLGFKVEASGSDVKVSSVRVKFTAAVDSAASDRLTSYADKIVILADGVEVGMLNTGDFVRDSSGVYSASIPVSHVVKMGSANRSIYHVGFKSVSSIDSDDAGPANAWTALFVSLRFQDAAGVTLTDSSTGITNGDVYVKRVSASSDVKLRMAEGSGNPKAGNIKVSTSGSQDVVLAEFTLKAEGASMYFDQLKASTTVTGVTNVSTLASDFYLMRGSSRLAELAATTTSTSQGLTFSLDDTEEIASGSTQTYKIVVKVKAITAGTSGGVFDQGDTIVASTSVNVWNINAKADSDGKSVTERSGSVTTYTQTLYSEGIQVTKVSESFTSLPNATTPGLSEGEFKVTLRVANFGSNDVYIPLNSLATTSVSAGSTKGIAFGLATSTAATSTGQSGTITGTVTKTGSGGVEKTNSVLISGGQSADFVLTTTFNPDASHSGTGQYRVQIWSVGHATTDTATAATIVNTTPTEDFRTEFKTIQN